MSMYLYRPGMALATHSIAFFFGVYTSSSVKSVLHQTQDFLINKKSKLEKKIEKAAKKSASGSFESSEDKNDDGKSDDGSYES